MNIIDIVLVLFSLLLLCYYHNCYVLIIIALIVRYTYRMQDNPAGTGTINPVLEEALIEQPTLRRCQRSHESQNTKQKVRSLFTVHNDYSYLVHGLLLLFQTSSYILFYLLFNNFMTILLSFE